MFQDSGVDAETQKALKRIEELKKQLEKLKLNGATLQRPVLRDGFGASIVVRMCLDLFFFFSFSEPCFERLHDIIQPYIDQPDML